MADYGFDSVPQAILERALQHNFSLEEKARREQAQLNWDFYFGKQEQLVKLLNIDEDPLVINWTKPIIHKRASMLYPHPLVREFDGPRASVNFLQQVYKDNSIDAIMLQTDLMAELTGSALLMPLPDPSLPAGIRLRLYDARQFSAVGNDGDPTTADAISLVRVVDQLEDPSYRQGMRQPDVERVLEQQVWSAQDVKIYAGEGMSSREQAQYPNPYGFLPFVNFRGEEVHDEYVGYPPATNVQRLNMQINAALTHLGYMVKLQAGTPIVLSGFESGEPVVVHPGRAIKIPAGGAAAVLDLQPKLDETLRFINYLEEQMFSTSSVPRITIVGGQEGAMGRRASGRELLVRWFPLLQVFREKTTRFARYELELANMILAVNHRPAIEDLQIHWPEESILPLSAESDQLVQDIQLGVETPVSEIRRRNPTLTESEAFFEFRENLAINDMLPKDTPATTPLGGAKQDERNLAQTALSPDNPVDDAQGG